MSNVHYIRLEDLELDRTTAEALLKRLGGEIVTYESFNDVLAQLESVQRSRMVAFWKLWELLYTNTGTHT